MKKNYFFISLLLFFALGCSNKDNNVEAVELTLDKTNVSLVKDNSSTVVIKTGNGDYTVKSSNNEVVTATLTENTITIKSTTKEDKANAIVVVADKMNKRVNINVSIAKLFNLVLEKSTETVEVNSVFEAKILEGNLDYKVELLNNSENLVELDKTKLELRGILLIKALAPGVATIKIKDALDKEATLTLNIAAIPVAVSKQSVSLSTIETEDITILNGSGAYKVEIANPFVANVTLMGNRLRITGVNPGTTTFTVTSFGQVSETIAITVAAANNYALNMGTSFFGYANFSDIAPQNPSIKACKQVTFEINCKMSGYRGLQTFLGLEGQLIMRGKNDDYRETHPIEIAGLGDNIMMLSTNSFDLNKWYNLALVVDCEKSLPKDKYKLYINGVQETLVFQRTDATHSSIDLTSSGEDGRFVVGRAFNQDFRAMQGVISEARVWTVARTEEQIKNNMCTLSKDDVEGLLAKWDFSSGLNTDYVLDSGGNKYKTILSIANVKNNYMRITPPESAYVNRDCPQ